jgi:hypothetical protein
MKLSTQRSFAYSHRRATEATVAGRDKLEVFIDESIRRCVANRYHPTAFVQMRDRWGTREAMKRLVVNGELQSGFRRLRNLGLTNWSIEAAVIRFPAYFDKGTREAARLRLSQVNPQTADIRRSRTPAPALLRDPRRSESDVRDIPRKARQPNGDPISK